MGRQVLGAVAGYVAMALFIMLTFAAAFPVLGMNRLFEPGTYEATSLWVTMSFVLGLAGAFLGGFTAAAVGKSPRAVYILAACVLLFGIVSALAGASDTSRGGSRPPEPQ